MTCLLADIPRCYGIDRHPKCESCARKHQMERDDDTRWFPMVAAVPDEREACAAICDELESFWPAEKDVALLNGDVALSNASSGEPRAARAIAQAIRARGEK